MRSSARVLVSVAMFALGAAAPASAQFAYLGGGLTIPLSTYGEYANTGYMVSGGLGMPLGDQGLSIVGEAFFGQNNHSDTEGDFTNPWGFMGGIEYDFAGAEATQSPYVFGGVGIFVHRYGSDQFESSSSSGLGLLGGAGYFFPLGVINGYVEGRLQHASIDSENTTFVGVIAGISIPLGSN